MPRNILGILIVFGSVLLTSRAQPMPQTARQALIEIFSGGFEKHLPEATLAVIRTASPGSPASMVAMFSLLSTQMHANGTHYQSFDAGPTLLTVDDPKTNSRFEVLVSRDDLRGQDDEIELTFKASKNGESQNAGISSHLTLVMRQENSIWRLHGISVTVGISLTDPAFLKAIATPVRPQVTTTATSQIGQNDGVTFGPSNHIDQASGAPFGSSTGIDQASAAASIRAINTAEVTYAATYPAQGFACSLSSLGGMGGGYTPDEQHAMLLDPRLSSGRKGGYSFRISNCGGSPATSYRVTAAPAQPAPGVRAFCSDQSGVVRFSEDGMDQSCLSASQPPP
jgi:type IV pilus assembly protein PilA